MIAAYGVCREMSDVDLAHPALCEARAVARPGRPRTVSEQRRKSLLIDAAEAVFLERGYHASTMDDVAQQAGMSKKTVYQVFTAKAALFEALLIDRLGMLTMPIEEDGLPLAESLLELLVRLGNFVLSPKQVALLRLMVAEGRRSPELVEALKRLEIGRGRGPLERWFAHKRDVGQLDIADPQENASIAFGMALGEFWCASLLNIVPRLTEAEIRARARRCVPLLLRLG